MNSLAIVTYGIGFVAQGLFSSRLFVQWFLSEKQKKVVTPSLFWLLSLAASFLLFIYGYLRSDFAIMLGQSLTYFIYIRNIQLQGKWKSIPLVLRAIVLLVPVALVIYYFNNNRFDLHILLKNEAIPQWLLYLGIASQLLFTFRFFYQWLYSERQKESSLPMGFWVVSITGASLILTYAVFRHDPVLFLGHFLGICIYSRNLYIMLKHA